MVQVKLTRQAVDYVALELGITYDTAEEILQSALCMCKFDDVPAQKSPAPTLAHPD